MLQNKRRTWQKGRFKLKTEQENDETMNKNRR